MFVDKGQQGGVILFVESIRFFGWIKGPRWQMVTLSPLTSEAGVQSPSWPQVGKLVVACRWSAVYSTDP